MRETSFHELKECNFSDVDATTISHGIYGRDAEPPALAVHHRDVHTKTPVEWFHSDIACQVPEKASRSVQTTQVKHNLKQGDIYSVDSFRAASFSSTLRFFLARASATMLSELASELSSQHIFDKYLPSRRGDVSGKSAEHMCTLTWTRSKILTSSRSNDGGCSFYDDCEDEGGPDTGTGDGLEVTGVDWNASGSSLAATFGKRDWSGWCDSTGAIAVWSLLSKGFEPKAPPLYAAEHGSHLTCIAAHPEKPSIFAVGSFYGEVIAFDFNQPQDPSVACSKIDEYFHRERIESLAWVFQRRQQDWFLCSVSKDGRVLLWDMSNKFKYPVRGIRTGKYGRSTSADPSDSVKHGKLYGGTAVAAPSSIFQQTSVFIGSQGGAVQRVSLQSESLDSKPAKIRNCKMKWSNNALQLISQVSTSHKETVAKEIEGRAALNKRRGIDSLAVFEAKPPIDVIYPVTTDFEYNPHSGPVTSIDTSPFDRNIFLTCGADGEIRIFSNLYREAILTFIPTMCPNSLSSLPLHHAKFSPTKPTVRRDVPVNLSLYEASKFLHYLSKPLLLYRLNLI